TDHRDQRSEVGDELAGCPNYRPHKRQWNVDDGKPDEPDRAHSQRILRLRDEPLLQRVTCGPEVRMNGHLLSVIWLSGDCDFSKNAEYPKNVIPSEDAPIIARPNRGICI